MLKRPLPGRMRVRVGALAVCCAVAVTGMTAWAIQPASMAAPARRGIFHEQGVAFAYVRTTKDVLAKFRISGPSMGPGGDPDTTRVVLDRRADLRIGATDAIGPWELRLRGVGTPSNAPGVEWKLMRGAVVAARGQQPVSAGGRSTLMVTGDSIPALPLIELSRLPADGIVEYPGEGQPPSSMLTRESDGSWLDDGTGWVVGDRFGANGGRAVLLAHVDANGRVQRVEIESANPAGSLTQAAAIDLLKDKVYSPQLVNGKAVSSRIRIPLNYWRENPEPRKQVVASEASAAVVDTPAPRYPADALKKRIGGFVMLHLLVSADGKVKDVRVVSASPKGTFEDVSVEAAKRWTLQPPQEEGGKPVEGWVQVPITFDPNRSKDGTPVQG